MPEEKAPETPTAPIDFGYPSEPKVTDHSIKIGRKTLNYQVTVGTLPLKNHKTGEKEADIFFVAYTLKDAPSNTPRPLTFSFNGGPGSSSVWLHLGALGPKRVKMLDDGSLPPPPFELVDNPDTWLDETDLVFVDPVGTGYSRAAKEDLNKKFWSLNGDLDAMAEFIRLYLSRYQRWTSPLFLAGESYGTTRAGGLTGLLVSKGIALNGIMLISTILNFQTLDSGFGNDLPSLLFLPTYTATAWYHKKLSADLQKKPLTDVLKEVEQWLETEYHYALLKGDSLDAQTRQQVIEKLAYYTGLTPEYIDQTELRVLIYRFCKELLRDQKRTVGRLDSRFVGTDAVAVSEHVEFDPAMATIMPPYTALLNQYVREALQFEVDLVYEILSGDVFMGWTMNEGKRGDGYADTSDLLRQAFTRNPHMKVFVASGYYDLATPYYAAEYTLNHMYLPSGAHDRIQIAYYEAGHMMYIDVKSLKKLKTDVKNFIQSALNKSS